MSERLATPFTIYARRFAHTIAGVVTTVWIGGVVGAALPTARSERDAGWVAAAFLASWVIWPIVYAVATVFAGARFARLLERAATRRSTTESSPPEALVSAMERIAIARSGERSATAWPLITFVFLFPLTLHFVLVSAGLLMFGERQPLELDLFGTWITISAVTVGHSHVVLAICAWVYAEKIEATPTHALEISPRYFGAKAYLLTVFSAMFSFLTWKIERRLGTVGSETLLCTMAATVIVAFTGIPIVPFFSRARKRVLRDRQQLDRALLGSDGGTVESRVEKLTAIACWKQGPEELRLLAFDALADHGQRVHARGLIDDLLLDAPTRFRQRLLAISIELYHRPPLKTLLGILNDSLDGTSKRLACKLIEYVRDPAAEPALIYALDDPQDDVVTAAASALARCGTIAAVESLKKLTGTMLRRASSVAAARHAIDCIQAKVDPARAHGELSVVGGSQAGEVSFASDGGGLALASPIPADARSPT